MLWQITCRLTLLSGASSSQAEEDKQQPLSTPKLRQAQPRASTMRKPWPQRRLQEVVAPNSDIVCVDSGHEYIGPRQPQSVPQTTGYMLKALLCTDPRSKTYQSCFAVVVLRRRGGSTDPSDNLWGSTWPGLSLSVMPRRVTRGT